ncbi:amino acid adenylation domain-containing protein [Gloeocapsopsis sp. IPPAS B-1203]|uniref:non-ribosomal peptide synthetase n=1 Tax=Gloeocapsopsis sp. IPPAS B-1203 TaxID=2049454 RepID=UPI0025A2AC70|nr:amino acid adenylation domain-containing protein [Gloeocapsopsis sp. IPPAS B-1203]
MKIKNENFYLKQDIQREPLNETNFLQNLEVEHNASDLSVNSTYIHQMFEAQVMQAPDAVAVVFDNKYFTYQQLNQRANQLAHYLQSLGVGPEVLVGICIERSLEMVVGLLGILKAGGAYVPLEPEYPLERLSFILQETQVEVLLTQKRLAQSLPTSRALICLDSDWEVISQQSKENLVCETTGSNLAYVIYTSGSTGQPKGVMICHAGICNQLWWRQNTFPLTTADKVLLSFSFSFDPSVWQIFWPLSCGAQLVLARPGGHQDSAYLVKLIAEQQITTIAMVPAMLRLFLEEREVDACKCLRYVFCGGEALPAELQTHFFTRLNLDNVLHNVYGPTEASIDATYWCCDRNSNYQIAPIGRPIANTQVYILSAELQPVFVGVPGELYISGAGLARGYLNRPQLTAEKFIPHPFNSEPGSRLYKTGDLARFLPDGNIEFLGRIDHQLKIRGFRIELEEIEAVLRQHDCVKHSVVMGREDTPGDKRLVAYIIPSQEQAPTTSELRCFLKERLPDYMIPAVFIILKSLPLNANGKVDRHALPAPQPERPSLQTPFVSPQDPLELQLTNLWEQVLKTYPVGVRDNFFELGGNSLLAARLFSRIEEMFSEKLPLATLFQAPTIEQLACILQEKGRNTSWKSLVAIQPKGSKPPFFFVHTKGGNVLGYRSLAHYLGDQPFYGLQAKGLDGKQTPHTRIEEMAADYIREIQELQPFGPYFIGGYSFGGLIAYEMARQLQAQGQKIAALVLVDTYNRQGLWFEKVSLRSKFSRHLNNLLRLTLKAKFAYIKQKLKQGFYLPKQSTISLQTTPLQAAFDQAIKTYVPQAYSGKLLLFRATQQHKYWSPSMKIDSQLGWSKLVAEGIEIKDLPGHHFNLLREPCVQILAESLQAYLDSMQASK